MRISIIVPTCPAQQEDTFSPKSALSYRYQGQDDYTISTKCSSESSLVSEDEYASHTRGNTNSESYHSRKSFIPDEELRENVNSKPVQATNLPSGETPRSGGPLAANNNIYNTLNNNIYNTLVIGHPSTLEGATGGMEGEKFRYPTPSSSLHSNMNRSVSPAVLPSRGLGNHVMYDECAPSQDEVYQRLVVGAGTPTPIRQMPSLHSPSFQSLESNFSRQVVYQAQSFGTNRHWNPQASLPADITEEEEDEEEADNEILAMIESGEMYRAWVVAPLMMAAATLCLGMDESNKIDPKMMMSKQTMRRQNETHSSSIQHMSCAAEAIEKDLLSMLRFNLLGGKNSKKSSGACHDDDHDNDDDDDDDNEDDVPITRLSADLRKQRLRNQVLSYERDTMNQENNQLRDRLTERDAEIEALKIQVQELTNRAKKAEDEAMERGVKLAQMMNELLETQT